jgi:DNA-directed RNA polymerase
MTNITKNKPDLIDLIDKNFEEIVKGKAWYYANKYGRSHPLINQEDLAAEGMLATVKAYELFNPAKGAFSTYAFIYVDKAMLNYCNKYCFQLSAGSRDIRNKMPAIQAAHSGIIRLDEIDIPYTPTADDGIDLEEYFCEGFTEADKVLVYDRFIHNMKLKDIAYKHHMSVSGVYSRIKRLSHKLKERGMRYKKS